MTGAAGFWGSAICRVLTTKDVDIIALVLPGDPYATYLPNGIEIVEGGLSKHDTLAPFFRVDDHMFPLLSASEQPAGPGDERVRN